MSIHSLVALVFITLAPALAHGQVAGLSVENGPTLRQDKNKQLHPSALEQFVQNIRTIAVGSDGPDDVIAKIGAQPWSRDSFNGRDTWRLVFEGSSGPDSYIHFDEAGKVAAIRVTKSAGGTMSEVLVQGQMRLVGGGDQSGAESFVALAAPPTFPREGQVYFDTKEKHFYGWNGSAWIKLGGD